MTGDLPAFENLVVELTDGVVHLTLNRPEKMNAIDKPMVDDLHAALDLLAPREDVKVLILSGAGERAFVAGADIAALRARKTPEALLAINARLFQKLEEFPVPTIAAIRGYALGGGCELAMSCDIRVAGRSAKLGQPEVGLGIIPAAGGTQRMPRIVGLGMAKELIFTGEIIDAERALAIGLVNHVVPDDQVAAKADELAGRIARQGGLALRLAKVALNASSRGGQDMGFLVEQLAQAVAFESEDKHARMTKFLERKARKSKEG